LKIEKLISKFKDVKVEAKKRYHNGRAEKGALAGSQEILFVCKPKIKTFCIKINNKEL